MGAGFHSFRQLMGEFLIQWWYAFGCLETRFAVVRCASFFCLCAPSYQEQERARRKPQSAHAKNQHRVVCLRVKVKPRAVQATLTRSNRPHDARRIPETVSGNIPQPRNIGDWRFFNPSRNSRCGAFPGRETLGIGLDAWTALRPRESRTSGAGRVHAGLPDVVGG